MAGTEIIKLIQQIQTLHKETVAAKDTEIKKLQNRIKVLTETMKEKDIIINKLQSRTIDRSTSSSIKNKKRQHRFASSQINRNKTHCRGISSSVSNASSSTSTRKRQRQCMTISATVSSISPAELYKNTHQVLDITDENTHVPNFATINDNYVATTSQIKAIQSHLIAEPSMPALIVDRAEPPRKRSKYNGTTMQSLSSTNIADNLGDNNGTERDTRHKTRKSTKSDHVDVDDNSEEDIDEDTGDNSEEDIDEDTDDNSDEDTDDDSDEDIDDDSERKSRHKRKGERQKNDEQQPSASTNQYHYNSQQFEDKSYDNKPPELDTNFVRRYMLS